MRLQATRIGRIGARIGIVAGLLLAILLPAALLLPQRIDWDGYRDNLAQHAAGRLGRSIALEGALRLSLLPATVLEADGVRIGPSIDQVELSARALRLRLDPWRLLLGRVVVREVSLVGADVSLPWPPAALPGLPSLDELIALDARIEDSRISLAGARIEGVSARLLAGGPAEALRTEGRFEWRGQRVNFQASLGRAGDDGVAPIDITAQFGAGRLAARGVLLADGGFEGRVEATGPDLSALLPTPGGAFAATGRITATRDAIALDPLAIRVAGQAGRGGLTLRLAPTPRLDAALTADRLDLDAWTGALRAAVPALPMAFTLAAAESSLLGVALNDLRLAVQIAEGRITVTQAGAMAGEARLSVTGAGERDASEWAVRLDAPRGAQSLAVFAPLRLRAPQGAWPEGPLAATFRMALDERQAVFSDIAVQLGAERIRGAATWRHGARPFLGLGLEFTWLAGDPWLGWAEMAQAMDLDLRIGAERATLLGTPLEALRLDAAAEAGRLVLRRATARRGRADLSATASGTLNPLRVQEAQIETQGGSLGDLLWPWWRLPVELDRMPARARATLSGAPDALALRLEADAEDARLEAALTVDARQMQAQGVATLRHPGAPRLLGPFLPPGWVELLGQGSVSAVAPLSLRRDGIATEGLDLVAGALRLRGGLNLAEGRLSGELGLEQLSLAEGVGWPNLPLPPPGLALELGLSAERLTAPLLPPLSGLRASLRGDAAGLALELPEWRIDEGRAQARLSWAADAVGLEATLAQVPLGGARVDATLRLNTSGRGAQEWLAGLGGAGEVVLADGRLDGLDLAALLEAGAEPDPSLAALEAVSGGATPFTRLALPFTAVRGQFRLGAGAVLEGPVADGRLLGFWDAARDALDATLTLPRPAGPAMGVRLRGPILAPRGLPLIEDHLRWREGR